VEATEKEEPASSYSNNEFLLSENLHGCHAVRTYLLPGPSRDGCTYTYASRDQTRTRHSARFSQESGASHRRYSMSYTNTRSPELRPVCVGVSCVTCDDTELTCTRLVGDASHFDGWMMDMDVTVASQQYA